MQWANDVPPGVGRVGSNVPGPRLYEPAGKRFQLRDGASPTSRSFSCAFIGPLRSVDILHVCMVAMVAHADVAYMA